MVLYIYIYIYIKHIVYFLLFCQLQSSYGIIGLWIFLAPLSTIFQLYHGGQFFFIVRRGNIRNRIKKTICHKSMTNVHHIRPPDEMGELLLVWDEKSTQLALRAGLK